MRKIISTILVLTMVLSLFTFSVSAEHWADDAINFVTENGYWISSTPLEPDKVATRAETASLFARILISKITEYNGAYTDVSSDNIYGGDITAVTLMGLMNGYDGKFRPDDTLTREELACILDRAAKMVSDKFKDKEYNMELYKDGDDVSEWALQSVRNCSAYVFMKGIKGKSFAPQGTTTLAEVATVVKTLAETAELEKANTVTSSSRDIKATDNIKKDFDVLQSGGLYEQVGWVGFGMLARFDGTPGDIYVARKHPQSARQNGYNEDPVAIVRVVDPNGNVVAREYMYWKDYGTMEKIINIPDGQPGIYRIQFVGGNQGDTCTIGVKNPVSWGVYGESEFRFTETTPKTSYFWVPWKYDAVYIGLAGGEGSVYTADGEVRITPISGSTSISSAAKVSINTLETDTVYMLKVDEGFTGRYELLGASPVLCPTEEMARDLKGGYIWYEDEYGAFQFNGPLQVRARKRMVEIYEELGGDFEVTGIEVPKLLESPDAYDNVRAEALLYSKYSNSIAWIKTTFNRQILDPSSPWMGTMANSQAEVDSPSKISNDWQTENYAPTRCATNEMVGALTINAETNAYYANPIVQKRVELEYLAWVMQMRHSGCYYYNPVSESMLLSMYTHTYENFLFGEHGLAIGYKEAQNYLSPQTRAITDEGLVQISEVVIYTRGSGASNQSFMCIEGSLFAYLFSGMKHFKDYFEMTAVNAGHPTTLPHYMGQAEAGYFFEGLGSDGGSYGRMCEGMWDHWVFTYLTLPEEERDPEIAAKIYEATERFLAFDSLWYAPAINGFPAINPAAYTGRVNSAYGSQSGVAGIAYITGLFPRAKRAQQVATVQVNHVYDYSVYNSAAQTLGTFAHTDAQAYKHLKTVLTPKMYDNSYVEGTDFHGKYGGRVSNSLWEQYHLPQQFEDSEIPRLPFELLGDYNVYDPPAGTVALKHKGIYMNFFYDVGLRSTREMSGKSWYSGGPMQVWDEYFGTVMSSQKPAAFDLMKVNGDGTTVEINDYRNYFSENEMVHTAIMGKETGGGLFIEGRAYGDIKWFDDKSFEIRSEQCFYERDTVWQYFMTDEGYEINVGMDQISDKDDLWVQFAVIDPGVSVNGAQLVYTGDSIIWEHNGKTLTMSWDDSVESRLRDKVGSKNIENYKYLQLKLTSDMPMVKIKITRDVGDYVFNSGYETNFDK